MKNRFSQTPTAELVNELEQLKIELESRERNPTWFFRDLVEQGYDLDDDGFCQATEWMDDPGFGNREEY